MLGAQFTLAESYSEAKQEEEADAFKKHLFQIAAHGQASMAIALGLESGWFRALAKAGSAATPASSDDVAREAGAKPRYVQEWLSCMATAGLVEVDETGRGFWIPEERLSALVGGSDGMPDTSLIVNCFLPMFGGAPYKEVAKVVRSEGPLGLGYGIYEEFHKKMGSMSHTMHKKHLNKDFVDSMGKRGELEKGIEVLDVGCGAGFHVLEMAKGFKNSRFSGVDIDAHAIAQATAAAKHHHLSDSTTFVASDAAQLPEDWSNRFDLVLIFDACHDQCRPDLALKEIHRCLKPGGMFAMLEINGTSNCFTDREKLGTVVPTWMYGVSLFHCLPLGSNCEGALQLGTMMGVETGKQLLELAGFHQGDIQLEWPPYFPLNVLYKAVKRAEEA